MEHLSKRVLDARRRGDLPLALDHLYQLAHQVSTGDPVSAFLTTAKKLIQSGFSDSRDLVNYLKLSGYTNLPSLLGQDLRKLVHIEVQVRDVLDSYLDSVAPHVVIAAVELVRRGFDVRYVELLGPSYAIALDIARVLRMMGSFVDVDDMPSHRDAPELLMDRDQLVLAALLGPNLPVASAVLGGKSVRVPGPSDDYKRRKARVDPLIAAAIARAVDRYLSEVYNPEGSPGELLDRVESLLKLARLRSRVLERTIAGRRSDVRSEECEDHDPEAQEL